MHGANAYTRPVREKQAEVAKRSPVCDIITAGESARTCLFAEAARTFFECLRVALHLTCTISLSPFPLFIVAVFRVGCKVYDTELEYVSSCFVEMFHRANVFLVEPNLLTRQKLRLGKESH